MRRFRITVDGTPYEVSVEELDDGAASASAPVASAPRPEMITPVIAHAATGHPPPPPSQGAAAAVVPQPGDVASPLAGTVVKVEVAVGATVTQGQAVLALEAMKMITAVTAPRAGTVTSIAVTPGQSVAEGQVLMTIA